MNREEAQRAVHEAVQKSLDDGELAVSWCLTIEVAGPDDTRYLAHRGGGGIDGTDAPMMWAALGMLTASADVARSQLAESTHDPDDDEAED